MPTAMKFAPPPVRVPVKLDLDREVHAALLAEIERHNAEYPDAGLKLDEALTDLVNRAVKSAMRGNGRARRA